jgi:hypothetical protein
MTQPAGKSANSASGKDLSAVDQLYGCHSVSERSSGVCANTQHGICLQQAQRLLWQGGVLGDKGEFALMTLDNELRERQFAWPDLRSLLAITGFLATFPAGPLFAD